MDKNSFVYMAITNIFSSAVLHFITRIFLIFYIAHVKSWVKAIPVLIVVFSLLLPIPIITTAVRFLGIIDLGFPFRETIKKKE
jgi:uncharacterized protein YybS (DUF2232 family)